jgi:glycosyltransferase involved in cell wall biosynthesis
VNLTTIILTRNEEPNLARTLERLSDFSPVIVVDSFSTDATVDIAKRFSNVTILQRPFDEHTKQWEFARNNVSSEWTLALDADYQVSVEAKIEIKRIISSNPVENGFFANFRYAIEGEIIASGIYPPVCVLYRTKNGVYKKDGHTQRLSLDGKVGFLKNKLIHDDRKSFQHWVNSQLNYARLEAEKLRFELHSTEDSISRNDKIRLKSKWTPVAVFFYCIFVKNGWKDGKAGWKYAFQRLLAEVFLQYALLEIAPKK